MNFERNQFIEIRFPDIIDLVYEYYHLFISEELIIKIGDLREKGGN